MEKFGGAGGTLTRLLLNGVDYLFIRRDIRRSLAYYERLRFTDNSSADPLIASKIEAVSAGR